MPERPSVLVIGTTSDYVEWIRNARPGQVVFVTSPEERRKAVEPAPPPEEEILCDLENTGQVLGVLMEHLRKNRLAPVGVACFDCESMPLAAAAAGCFNLDYPSPASIRNCRDKSRSKTLWREHGIDCPAFSPISALPELASFFIQQKGPVVLKPVTGSGSELVYRCNTQGACEEAYRIITAELERRKENRLYSGNGGTKSLLVEEMAIGREFSCDFIWTGTEVKVIRVAEKIKPLALPFGTIGGYLLPASLPPTVPQELLPETLAAASRALGLSRCICMADFMVSGNRVVMIEMTPRPGGDCLPSMVRHAMRMDMLAVAVDFAAGQPVTIPDPTQNGTVMGIRIHARKAGVLGQMEIKDGRGEYGILETRFIRNPGHEIHLPPADYESWFLGHVIVKPAVGENPQQAYQRILNNLYIEIEDGNDGTGYDRRAARGSAA